MYTFLLDTTTLVKSTTAKEFTMVAMSPTMRVLIRENRENSNRTDVYMKQDTPM
jgi:hypothetical protein